MKHLDMKHRNEVLCVRNLYICSISMVGPAMSLNTYHTDDIFLREPVLDVLFLEHSNNKLRYIQPILAFVFAHYVQTRADC